MRTLFLAKRRNDEYREQDAHTVFVDELTRMESGLDERSIDALFKDMRGERFRYNLVSIYAYTQQKRYFADSFYQLTEQIPAFDEHDRARLYFILERLLIDFPQNKRLLSESVALSQRQFALDRYVDSFLSLLCQLLGNGMEIADKLTKALDLVQFIISSLATQGPAVYRQLLRIATQLEFQYVIAPGYFLQPTIALYSQAEERIKVDILEYSFMCCNDAHARDFLLQSIPTLCEALSHKNVGLWGQYLGVIEALINGPKDYIRGLQQQFSTLNQMEVIYEALMFIDYTVQFRALYTLKHIASAMPDLLIEEDLIVQRVLFMAYSPSCTIWPQALQVLAAISQSSDKLFGIELLHSKIDITNTQQLISIVIFLESYFAIKPTLRQQLVDEFEPMIEHLYDSASQQNIYSFLYRYSLMEAEEEDTLFF